jgi:hypothetical protein
VGSSATPDKFACVPYCDHVDANAANACAKLCPTLFSPIYAGESLEAKGAICFAGAGGACEPLLQDCDPGQNCTGLDVTGCEPAGTIKAGESCLALGGGCEKGTVCVGVQGEPDQFCQPYCDNAAEAVGAQACPTKCPGGHWDYPGYGICIPD